jgi:hypothetical protein
MSGRDAITPATNVPIITIPTTFENRIPPPNLNLTGWPDENSAARLAAAKKLGPFILVEEGSIPDETNKKEGYWA